MDTHPTSSIRPVHLITGLTAVIALQFAVVAASGFTPPRFDAGYARPVVTQPGSAFGGLSQRALEAFLSPPPVLEWSERIELPDASGTPQEAVATPPARPAPEDRPETSGPDADDRLALLDRPPAEPRRDGPAPDLSGVPELPGTNYSPVPLRVEPVYLRSLPDMGDMSAAERKRRFIALLLPLVLRANQELEDRRARVLEAAEANDLAMLKQWGRLYGYEPENGSLQDYKRELMLRVAPVPVSIALAQGAVESGWGTSRFAVRGNALMGQWAWNRGAGIRPRQPRHEDMVVRAFGSLFDSVRAYMHNLNTHPAYMGFREVRGGVPRPPGADGVDRLLAQLDSYSEEGEAYIGTLRELIRTNNLLLYERAELDRG